MDHSVLDVKISGPALEGRPLLVREMVLREGLSRPFDAELTLEVGGAAPEVDGWVGTAVRIDLVEDNEVLRSIAGVVASVDDLLTGDPTGQFSFFALRVVPRLHLLSLNRRLRVFRDKNVPQLLREILGHAELVEGQDFSIDLDAHYPSREFVVQYEESDLAFLARLTEQSGITFYFVTEDSRDVVRFVDSSVGVDVQRSIVHDPRRSGHGVHELRRRVSALPSAVRLDDYDYSRPMLALVADAKVQGGLGDEVYEYGPNYLSPEVGRHLARVRAEEIAAGRDVYQGVCSLPILFAGARVDVESAGRGTLGLLITELEGRFVAHDGGEVGGRVYDGRFHAIPASVPFRPARRTPRPHVRGLLTGTIDAAQKGEYAELDEHGRYRVKLLFDQSGLNDGHASLPIRMAQSHAGPGYGMHFPLRPGVEVLIAFVDGDPDRPVIAACVPNPLTPSPVTQTNATKNVIRTGSNNEIHLDDQKGAERIKLSTPRHSTVLQLGAPNAPEEGIHLATEANFTAITKSASAAVSTGNSLLSARQALISGNLVSLAGKTVPERIKAIMEMGEAVTELIESLAEAGLATVEQPTKAVLSAEVEKATKDRDDAASALEQARAVQPPDAEDVEKKQKDLDDKKERLEHLEEAEERLEQASQVVENTLGALGGAVGAGTRLVSFVCDVIVEYYKKKAIAANVGLFMSSNCNTIVAGAKASLDDELESPFNLIGSDGSAVLSGEKRAFVYGEVATMFGAERATVTSEHAAVAGIKEVEVSSKEKIRLHTTPASIQLMPASGITIQPSPGNVIQFTPQGALNISSEVKASIETADVLIEAEAGIELTAEATVSIESPSVEINAAASMEIESPTLEITAEAETTITSAEVTIVGDFTVDAPATVFLMAEETGLTLTTTGANLASGGASLYATAEGVTISGPLILIG